MERELEDDKLLSLIKKVQESYSDKYLIYVVPGYLAKKFSSYISMKNDLELTLKYIIELRQCQSSVVTSSLTYSLISLYGRCFVDATKNSYPKLEPSNLFSNETENRKTHDYLMNLRHEFIAHRGKTVNEIGITYVLIPKEGILDKNQIKSSLFKMNNFSEKNLKKNRNFD